MYVCMYVRMYVCSTYMYVCVHKSMYALHIRTHVHTYTQAYIWVYIPITARYHKSYGLTGYDVVFILSNLILVYYY